MSTSAGTSGTNFCSACGFRRGNARFCPSCGAKQEPTSALHSDQTTVTSDYSTNPNSHSPAYGHQQTMQQSVAVGNSTSIVGRRLGAASIDIGGILLIGAILDAVFGSSNGVTVGQVMYLVLSVADLIILQGLTGQSLGKKLVGIKVVNEKEGGIPGIGMEVLRWLPIAFIIDFIVGIILILIPGKRKRLGDMLAGTLVVKA